MPKVNFKATLVGVHLKMTWAMFLIKFSWPIKNRWGDAILPKGCEIVGKNRGAGGVSGCGLLARLGARQIFV